ncbi:hypothetical protein AGOR_G00009690 [Albula goreensis]|uniref:Ig-like domain-containing protein n=1 Tax=Albula goreensis TaxID=1534307 RepID=A0A8T3EBS7_9TELE|nr:hypothetical protein AGOR_G00009690 [Albula goreensis]
MQVLATTLSQVTVKRALFFSISLHFSPPTASPVPVSSVVDTSSLSTVGSEPPVSSSSSSSSTSSTSTSSSSPPSSSSSELWSIVGGTGVRLLPPLLTDQAWGVQAHEAFQLLCLALGPSDLDIHWEVNGQRPETPVTEYRHALTSGVVLMSSWVRGGSQLKDSQYQCTATSHAGNETSKVLISLSNQDEESVLSRDLNQWRSALTDHEKLLQSWKKAWESCDGEDVL